MGASVTDGLSLLDDCLDIHNWSDYEENDVGFNIGENLKMTLYSQINPILTHFKTLNLLSDGLDLTENMNWRK